MKWKYYWPTIIVAGYYIFYFIYSEFIVEVLDLEFYLLNLLYFPLWLTIISTSSLFPTWVEEYYPFDTGNIFIGIEITFIGYTVSAILIIGSVFILNSLVILIIKYLKKNP